jgi:hypothetical protein
MSVWSVKLTTWTESQRTTNSAISSTEVILQRPLVQLWFVISSKTFRCLRQASLHKLGAMSLGALPWIQEEFQKSAFSPFPIVTTVLIQNNCLSTSLTGGSVPTQGLSSSAHSNHNRLLKRLKEKEAPGLVAYSQCSFWLSSMLLFL